MAQSCPNPRTCRCVPKPLPGQGDTGAPGPAGPPGIKGETGDQGPKGPRGDNATFPAQPERVMVSRQAHTGQPAARKR